VLSCFFVSDLHGRKNRYETLFKLISRDRPAAVFFGGDFLPKAWRIQAPVDPAHEDFINDYLVKSLTGLREDMGSSYPRIFLIMGNDDGRFEEAAVLDAAVLGVWEYINNRRVALGDFSVFGYACVPPTPFLLKDWEKYDVSRYVDPGAVSPEEGWRSVPVPSRETKHSTIKDDLEQLAGEEDLAKAIFLFHAPPYRTNLDISFQDRKMIEHVPLDRHLGSIAVRRFIELRQPLLTLHGHIHEAAGISHSWRDRIGRTHCFNAAHAGPELALVRFDPENLDAATRDLI
jgi:Icc-related predicted phosphoesterase